MRHLNLLRSLMKNKIKNAVLFFNPIYWPAWLGLGILWLITRLPFRIQMTIGKSIGRLLYRFSGKLKRITEINVKLCFPHFTLEQQNELIKKNFEAVGVGFIEAAMAWWLPDEKLNHLFHLQGVEYGEAALAKGKGIILVGPHFTSLEMVGRLLGKKYSFGVVYRPHKKAFVSFIQEKFRQKHYINYFARHRVRELLRALNRNMAIWFAYDIDAGEKSSVFAPFFGISTASLTSVSRMARLSGAAVVPVSFYRSDNEFRYEVVLSPALENFPSDDVLEDAKRLNIILEEAIRYKPEQYIWQYKRFKTRPPGEERFY